MKIKLFSCVLLMIHIFICKQCSGMLGCLICKAFMLNRYLNVLIIEVRLKSRQQRDPCGRVYYSLFRCTLQPHSGARIYCFSCSLSPPWLIATQVLVVKVDSNIQRGVSKFICNEHVKRFVLFFFIHSSCDEDSCQVCNR